MQVFEIRKGKAYKVCARCGKTMQEKFNPYKIDKIGSTTCICDDCRDEGYIWCNHKNSIRFYTRCSNCNKASICNITVNINL